MNIPPILLLTKKLKTSSALFFHFFLFIFVLSSCKKEGVHEAEARQPVITSLSLTQGRAGEMLHIEGTGFGTALPDLVVMVDTARAQVKVATPEKITIILPNLSPGKKQVMVKVKGRNSNIKEFLQVGPTGEGGNDGYYLSRGNIELHYQSTTDGGITTSYKSFLNGIRDTIGSRLYVLRTILPDAGVVDGAVMVNSNKTIYISYKDGAMQSLEDIITSDPHLVSFVGSSRVDLQACKLEYSIVSPK